MKIRKSVSKAKDIARPQPLAELDSTINESMIKRVGTTKNVHRETPSNQKFILRGNTNIIVRKNFRPLSTNCSSKIPEPEQNTRNI